MCHPERWDVIARLASPQRDQRGPSASLGMTGGNLIARSDHRSMTRRSLASLGMTGGMAVLIFSAACAARTLGEPSITGVVTNLQGGRILVEENPQETAGSEKASVRITEQTEIISASGNKVSLSDLRTGDRVRVWFTGPVMESYPVQATAARIEILDR
jgi:uncharacterized protein DUF3221